MIIGKNFQLTKKINSGSFGQIHLGVNLKNNSQVAIKLQPAKTKHPQLQYEAKLLAYLTENINPLQYGIPRLHFFGKTQKYNAMVMDLLGPSLQDLFQKMGKKFSLKTVVMIGIQLIERLQYLHSKKFIHRDIKPENFLLGVNKYCGIIFVIDLGLSKKYLQKNGEHIPYKDNKSLTGTPRYASLNSHLGIQQSRRDDLESVIYMLIYFLKGHLPWQNLKHDQNYDKYQKILQKKLSVSPQNLTMNLPAQFKQLVDYTRGLHFIQQPNYQLMKRLLEQALLNSGQELQSNDKFCWQIDEEIEQEYKPKIVSGKSIQKNKNQFTAFQFQVQDKLQKQDKANPFGETNDFSNDFNKEPESNNNYKRQKTDVSDQGNPFSKKNLQENNFFGDEDPFKQ